MKIPKHINILSEKYTIKIEPGVFESEDGAQLWGEARQSEKLIRLAKTDPTAMFKTLLHEIIHIVCIELDLYDSEHSEQFINRMSVGVVDTMLRNNFIKGIEK